MELITSKDNKRIKTIKKLISSASFRREEHLFTAEGLRLCDDALKSGVDVNSAYFSEDFAQKHPDFVERTKSVIPSCFLLKNSIFSVLCDTKTPQGVLFVIKTLDKTPDFDKMNKNGKVVALDNIQDPSNLGTILRTAEAVGIDGIVLSDDCCDIYSPKVARGSMGAVFRIPFTVESSIKDFISAHKDITSYASVVSGDAEKITDVKFSDSSLLVIGNEGNGVKASTIEACDKKITIPMNGRAESLNASAAAAILIWEMVK